MKFVPSLYSSELKEELLSLSTRCDQLGNIYHYVEYKNNDGSDGYARFAHLSSAMDFISSNFK